MCGAREPLGKSTGHRPRRSAGRVHVPESSEVPRHEFDDPGIP